MALDSARSREEMDINNNITAMNMIPEDEQVQEHQEQQQEDEGSGHQSAKYATNQTAGGGVTFNPFSRADSKASHRSGKSTKSIRSNKSKAKG